MASNWKTYIVDMYVDELVYVTIVSERWVVNEAELYYPSLLRGQKRENAARGHHLPDYATWDCNRYKLRKICSKLLFIPPFHS